MDVWEYEIISRVEQDISLVRFAHLWDILVNTQTFRKIHGKKREKFGNFFTFYSCNVSNTILKFEATWNYIHYS